MKAIINILSKRKKHHDIDEFTKREDKEVYCFFYDEDVFWFDYEGKRFGISIPMMLELRKKQLKEMKK